MDKIRVLIAERFPMFCRGLADVLAEQSEIEVVDQTHDGLEVIDKAKELIPDIILMDVELPKCDGIRATQSLQLLQPEVKVIILSPPEKKTQFFDSAIKAGAKGFLLKTATASELIKGVRETAREGAAISTAVIPLMLERLSMAAAEQQTDEALLTVRERDVMLLLMEGKSNRRIAEALSLSENTVKYHIRSILEKFDVNNRVEAACHAIQKGFALNATD
jgi:DNA-binding NarL/FixJ family response regulator